MRKLLIALLVVGLFAGVASAEELTKQTSRRWCHRHAYTDYYETNTDTQRNAIDAGAGLDLLLYKWEDAKWLSEVNLEMRKDFVDMERFSGYLVLKVDVSSLFDFLK